MGKKTTKVDSHAIPAEEAPEEAPEEATNGKPVVAESVEVVGEVEGGTAFIDDTTGNETIWEIVYENERAIPLKGWSPNTANRPHWSDDRGFPVPYHPGSTDKELFEGWEWVEEWHLDKEYTNCDEEGWSYASDFTQLVKRKLKGKSISEAGLTDFVRRRRWIRRRAREQGEKFVREQESAEEWEWVPDEELPFPKGPPTGSKHSWCEPEVEMKVRSPTYLKDKVKIMSKPPLLRLQNCDMINKEERVDNWCAHPESYVQKALSKGSKSFYLAINFQSPPHHLICTWVLHSTEDIENDKAFQLLWEHFIDGDDSYRDSRFKVIPSLVDAPWVVKRAVGNKPALLGTKLKHRYFRGQQYFEIDCDVFSSQVANMIVGVMRNYSKQLSIDLGFVIQGEQAVELPERLFGTVRLSKPNLDKARKVMSEEEASEIGAKHSSPFLRRAITNLKRRMSSATIKK
eukprot:Clim_evm52s149 gene=Clim_evmTU52s149